MNKQTQRIKILDYLRTHPYMTGMDAVTKLGIMSYTKRISELRRQGHEIESVWIYDTNRDGDQVRYVRYVLHL